MSHHDKPYRSEEISPGVFLAHNHLETQGANPEEISQDPNQGRIPGANIYTHCNHGTFDHMRKMFPEWGVKKH